MRLNSNLISINENKNLNYFSFPFFFQATLLSKVDIKNETTYNRCGYLFRASKKNYHTALRIAHIARFNKPFDTRINEFPQRKHNSALSKKK